MFRASGSVAGAGAGWYDSPPMNVLLQAGQYYIVAVSWNGTTTYYYDTGDSQATSSEPPSTVTPVGFDPLPTSFDSISNDQAIYYQTLEVGDIRTRSRRWAGLAAWC